MDELCHVRELSSSTSSSSTPELGLVTSLRADFSSDAVAAVVAGSVHKQATASTVAII
jgi:hypothetical protein